MFTWKALYENLESVSPWRGDNSVMDLLRQLTITSPLLETAIPVQLRPARPSFSIWRTNSSSGVSTYSRHTQYISAWYNIILKRWWSPTDFLKQKSKSQPTLMSLLRKNLYKFTRLLILSVNFHSLKVEFENHYSRWLFLICCDTRERKNIINVICYFSYLTDFDIHLKIMLHCKVNHTVHSYKLFFLDKSKDLSVLKWAPNHLSSL